MTRHACGLWLGLLVALSAVGVAQSVPEWQDPRVFGVNKEEPHATLTPFPTEAAALGRAPSRFVMSLNGV